MTVAGTQEQSYIGNVMMYSFCVGHNTDLCDNPPEELTCDGGAQSARFTVYVMMSMLIAAMFGQCFA